MPTELTNLQLMGTYLRQLREPENLDPDIRERFQKLQGRGEREKDPNDPLPGARSARIIYEGAPCDCTPEKICIEHELLGILQDIHARTEQS